MLPDWKYVSTADDEKRLAARRAAKDEKQKDSDEPNDEPKQKTWRDRPPLLWVKFRY